MAINIVSSPADNASANDQIVWKFQFSALGTPPVVVRMLYYLADSSGTRINEKDYHWYPKSINEILPVNINDLVIESVYTAFPSCNTGIVTDTNAVKSFKVYYAIASFDTSTGVDTVAAYSQTPVKAVWNTALNMDTASNFVWTGGKTGTFMNSYPTRMKWSTDGEQYAWFAGVGSIRITWYSSTGATLTTITHALTGATAKYVSLDWRCHSIAKPHSMLLEVNEGTGYVSYNISYDACTCRGFYTGLTFLDPLGGRSHIAINCPLEINIERAGGEIIRFDETITTKGRSFFNPSGKEKVKFTISLGSTPEDLSFAKALLGSPGHHILKMSEGGTKTWYKFILSPGDYLIIKQKETILIELTGYLSDDKSGQKIDI